MGPDFVVVRAGLTVSRTGPRTRTCAGLLREQGLWPLPGAPHTLACVLGRETEK